MDYAEGYDHRKEFQVQELIAVRWVAKFGAEVAGESERNEKIATKPRRPKLEPMRTHQGSHAYASWPWAAHLFGRTDTYVYAFRASMRMHRSILASINRGAFHNFKGSPLPHLA
ncbi:hypothetical protein PIB30_035898 [Stylosanthes scabra]|uniref:Uncharacterized protein n=1 Tax=Stylosanthes scabra TaxID=79078 RepID=A0ABU6VFE2_9FABA|nr:hypothetical protein [Stylosanthes scabra]